MKVLIPIIGVAVAYFIAAILGLSLSFDNSNVTPVWPPSGLSLGALLLLGRKIIPGITLGALSANIFVFYNNHAAGTETILIVSAVIALGNTLEAVAGRFFFHRYINSGLLANYRNVFKFLVITVLMCLPASLTGSLALCISGIAQWNAFSTLFQTWLLGDGAGILLITPLILSWAQKASLKHIPAKRYLELAVVVSALIFCAYKVFISTPGRSHLDVKIYMILPILMWSVYRFSYRITVAQLLLVSLFAVAGTVNGIGPFHFETLNASLLGLEFFISIISITFLSLSALLVEQQATQSHLSSSQGMLESEVRARTEALEKVNRALFSEVNKSKLIEAELTDAKEKLSEACKTAKLGHWEWNVKGNSLNWSDELFTIYKVDRATFKGNYDDFINCVHPEDRQQTAKVIEKAFRDHNPFDFYHRIIWGNGEVRWIHSQGRVILDQEGQVDRMFGTGMDVTEIKQKDVLHSLLASIVKHTSDAVISKSLDGNINSWNKGAEELYGYREEEILGKNISILIPADKREENDQVTQELQKGKMVSYYETTRLKKDGSLVEVGITVSAIKDIDDKIIGISAISRDISSLRQREEERFRLIVESAPNAMILVNQRGKIEFVNSQTLKMFGYTRNELIGQTIEVLLPERFKGKHPHFRHDFHQAPVARAMGSGRDLFALHKDGHEIPVEIGLNPIETIDGIMVLSAIIDISERKRSEEARRAKQVAEESLKMKDLFLSNMSHEIRTPLNAILGYTELLDTSRLSDEQKGFLNAVKMAGQNLVHIINDILDFSKIEAGKVQLEKIPMNLHELLDTLRTVMIGEALEKKLDFQITCPAGRQWIMGDPTRLTQILVNLLSNAIKFTEKGLVRLEVSEKSRNESQLTYLFRVEDTGIGIDPDKLSQIFDRFTQAESNTTRKYGGTGLGLSIVKSLVHQHGGDIMVKSQPGKGSIFEVEITFDICHHPEQQGIREKSDKNLIQADSPLDILVAEDNPINQKLVRVVLEKMGYKVDIAANGLEAIQKVQSAKYNLILMDISMPEMDGYQATTHIRETLKLDIPIIAMTAHAFPGVREKCMAIGMDNYITKPFVAEELRAKILGSLDSPELPVTINQKTKHMVNLNYLRSLIGDDPSDLNDFIKMFLEQAPEELSVLKQAIDASDFDTIGKAAHKMKSTVHNMGMEETAGLLKEIQVITHENKDLDLIRQQYTVVSDHCKQAIAELSVSSP